MNLLSLKNQVSAEEWQIRCDLAACYRLVALYGWSDLVFTHISAKLPDTVTDGLHQFLINPYGLMFDEHGVQPDQGRHAMQQAAGQPVSFESGGVCHSQRGS
jgi:hypothetical protein